MTQTFTPKASQGPDWLGGFLIQPPLWFKALVVLVGIAVLAVTVKKLVDSDLYISQEEQWSMVVIVATVEGVAGGTLVSMGAFSFNFVGDVLVGLFVGFIGVDALRLGVSNTVARLADGRIQLAAAWLGLFIGAVNIPLIAARLGAPAPPGLDFALGSLAAFMLFWTFAQEFAPGETVADAFRAASDK